MLTRFLLTALALLVPASALADYGLVNSMVDAVGANFGYQGSGDFGSIAKDVVAAFLPILTGVGVLVIIIFGYRMIIGQEDDVITKARTVMSGTIAGLVMAWLIGPFIDAFYGESGEVARGGALQGAAEFDSQVNGLVNWVLVIVAALAVAMIILSALKSFASGTSEEGIANMRKTVFSVIFGIILLVFRFVLSDLFLATTRNPAPVLANFLRPISFVMGFLALTGLIIVLYAGILCILSLGKEEQYTKAKGLLIRAGIGVIVILVSLAIVNFVILPGVE